MLLRGCLVILLIGVQFALGQQKPNPDWVNQKFSMFIHWGLYSEIWEGSGRDSRFVPDTANRYNLLPKFPK